MRHGHVNHVEHSVVGKPKPILLVAVVAPNAAAVLPINRIVPACHAPLVIEREKNLVGASPRFAIMVDDEIAGRQTILVAVSEDAGILEML
jgi:hypothetical protein